jgi:hypothetical protein
MREPDRTSWTQYAPCPDDAVAGARSRRTPEVGRMVNP